MLDSRFRENDIQLEIYFSEVSLSLFFANSINSVYQLSLKLLLKIHYFCLQIINKKLKFLTLKEDTNV